MPVQSESRKYSETEQAAMMQSYRNNRNKGVQNDSSSSEDEDACRGGDARVEYAGPTGVQFIMNQNTQVSYRADNRMTLHQAQARTTESSSGYSKDCLESTGSMMNLDGE